MEKCGFYKEHRGNIESNEINSHQQNTGGISFTKPYCTHLKHSPASREVVMNLLGSVPLLQCGGDFARCQIPPDLFTDIV